MAGSKHNFHSKAADTKPAVVCIDVEKTASNPEGLSCTDGTKTLPASKDGWKPAKVCLGDGPCP